MSSSNGPASRAVVDLGCSFDIMTNHHSRDDAPTDPVQAFEALRAELSLLRRAVEGLTAARERLPDYSPTLGAMNQRLDLAHEALKRIEASPAVRLTPVALVEELNKRSADARAEDRRIIETSRDALSRSLGWIDGMIKRGQAVEGQIKRQFWCFGAGVSAAVMILEILPRVL